MQIYSRAGYVDVLSLLNPCLLVESYSKTVGCQFCSFMHKAWIDGVMSRLLVSKRKMVAEIKDPGNLGEGSLWEKRLLGRGLTELHVLELA